MYNKKQYDQMIIKLSQEPVLEAELNKTKLDALLSKELNFQKNIKKCLTIKKNKTNEENIDELKEFVWLGFDWYDLIMNYEYYSKKKILIQVYSVEINNLKQYSPDRVTVNNELFYDSKTINCEDYLFLLKDDKDPDNLNKFVERMLTTKLVDYIGKKWKTEWELN